MGFCGPRCFGYVHLLMSNYQLQYYKFLSVIYTLTLNVSLFVILSSAYTENWGGGGGGGGGNEGNATSASAVYIYINCTYFTLIICLVQSASSSFVPSFAYNYVCRISISRSTRLWPITEQLFKISILL